MQQTNMTTKKLQKTPILGGKNSAKSSPSETIEKDQDELMTTLESIRGLLEQSESKLNAARESITQANTTTQNDTSALHSMRSIDDVEIVPILDQIIKPQESTDSSANIPELNSVLSSSQLQEPIITEENATNKSVPPTSEETAMIQTSEPLQRTEENKASLAILTKKNLLLDALDNFQAELEESLREELMKTMVSLEKDLKQKIHSKMEKIKDEILK